MRRTVFSFIFLWASFSNAQTPSIVANDFSWERYEEDFTLDEKRELILTLDHWIIDFLKSYPFSFIDDDELVSNFHIFDFSGDGKSDIVYYGPSGSEPFATIFLENAAGVYHESLAVYGNIISLSRPFPFLPYHIKIVEAGCCDNPYTCYSTYKPIKGDTLSYKLEGRICGFDEIKFPEKIQIPKLFITVNPTYTLRSAPYIPSELDESAGDNIIAIYKKGSEGYAIAEATDTTGRVWWFVLMKNNLGFESSEMVEEDKDSFYQFGWMSSRYLEEQK